MKNIATGLVVEITMHDGEKVRMAMEATGERQKPEAFTAENAEDAESGEGQDTRTAWTYGLPDADGGCAMRFLSQPSSVLLGSRLLLRE